jgi:catechol 2,3-dioxygenase-like lactoylglutathione lyase family enzyme
MVLNTRHTGFVVLDLDRFINFYLGLGLKLISRMVEEGDYIDNLVGLKNVKLEWAKLALPDGSLIELLQYHTHNELIQNNETIQLPNRLGCSHVALTVDNIQKVIEYICKSGGTIRNKYQTSPDGNVKVAYCYDMEGNILEIVENLKNK